MAEIFKEAQAFNNQPDRWNHDLSHKIYGSFQMGKLYPVMSEFMMPTDSAKLDIAALLQFMPTATPLQSNVRVIFHTFFQRMKNIYSDFPNMIEGLSSNPTPPYVLPSVREFKPGSLHDYLDVPCCVVKHGVEDLPVKYSFDGFLDDTEHFEDFLLVAKNGALYGNIPFGSDFSSVYCSAGNGVLLMDFGTTVIPAEEVLVPGILPDACKINLSQFPFKFGAVAGEEQFSLFSHFKLRVSVDDKFGFVRYTSQNYELVTINSWPHLVDGVTTDYEAKPWDLVFSRTNLLTALNNLGYEDGMVIHFDLMFCFADESLATNVDADSPSAFTYDGNTYSALVGNCYSSYFVNGSYSLSDFPLLCPYATKENPSAPIKLRAYRYRVYESIYNAFYRNVHGNQPFVIDGVTQYNKYNTTTAEGADETPYDFFCRNYELDAYTSCLPSPQQGNPPLVGISATGRLTVQDDDGTRSTAQLEDLPDGQQGLSISQINIANDSHRNIIMSLASSGFTINDLREANALQKFLETNIRKGFRYIDFIMGHFGKAPKHAEMDMPEFVGGTSIRLDVSKVTNTNAAASSENPNDVLGQFAGAAQAFGSSKNSITYYADDYGYLMTIMCIVPDTTYSQVLPKDFLYQQALDFPFPEFGNLGYQPITYEELCPIEAYKDYIQDNSKKLTDVFGYQRPQHELVWKPDTLHGQFLTSMNNYAISRFFDGRPELGNDFLTIKPEETQNVFVVTKADNDIAFGQIGFSLTMKRPVPRISIPSIGR